MNLTEFEALRDTGDKQIIQDIRFVKGQNTAPVVVAENVQIVSTIDVDLRLTISFNLQTSAATFNVHVPGTGPICRLDVGGPPHRPAGRGHKHSLQNERCPDRNLPDEVIDRPDLLGKPFRELFEEFCTMSSITHTGSIDDPES